MSVHTPHSDNDRINELTPDILQKYQAGNLNATQMHQVEKLLLDDPFAAEALEGIELIDNHQNIVDIEAGLNEKINQRIREENKRAIPEKIIPQRSIPLYKRPLNIAAAVLVLLVSGYLILANSDALNPIKSSQGPIALENSAPPEQKPAKPNEEQGNNQKNDQKGDETEAISDFSNLQDSISIAGSGKQDVAGSNTTKEINQPQPDLSSVNAQRNEVAKIAPEVIAKTETEVDLDIESSFDTEILAEEVETISDQPSPIANTEVELNKKESDDDVAVTRQQAIVKNFKVNEASSGDDKEISNDENKRLAVRGSKARSVAAAPLKDSEKAQGFLDDASLQKLIKGQVIAADNGQGMPGVSLLVKGTTKGVHTDINGFYSITLGSKDSILVYSFVGYETEEVKIGEQKEVNLDLEPNNMALNEIVVTAYGENSKEEDHIPFFSASPKGGNSKYRKYLQENLRFPEEAIENKIEGKVKVTFNVGTDGRLTDFDVRRSLGYGCDQEVLRLIKEGPRWQPAKKGEDPIKQKVRVRVKFKRKK